MAAWTLSDDQWDALDKFRFGTADSTVFRNATIILMSRCGPVEVFDCSGSGMLSGDRRQCPETVIGGMAWRACNPSSLRDDLRRHAAYRQVLRSGEHTTAEPGLWIQRLVGRSPERAPETANEDFFSDDQLRRIPSPGMISFQRPKHTMKGKRDEAAFTRPVKQLKHLEVKCP